MLDFFKRSDSKFKVIDKVWISRPAKWAACKVMSKVNPDCVFIAWFKKTVEELGKELGSEEKIMLADQAEAFKIQGMMVVFAEHYPLSKVEHTLFSTLGLKEIPIVSSLDEPLFMLFGGERTIELMRKLGMKEDEMVGHSMITASIKNAQRKLEKSIIVESKANSAEEWFELNLKK